MAGIRVVPACPIVPAEWDSPGVIHGVPFVMMSGEDDIRNVLPPRMAQYGVEEPFATGAPLRYPDFDVHYLGLMTDDGQKKWTFRLDHPGGSSPLVLYTGGVLERPELIIGDRRFSFAFARGPWANSMPEEARLIVKVKP